MSTQEQRPVTGVAALGLLVAGLVVLGLGRFVRIDHRPGFDSNEWVLPLGYLAAVLGIAAVVVAARNRTARLWLGGAFAVLDAVLIWQSLSNVNFRFVWGGDEGEMLEFQIGLGLLALLLIATAFQPARLDGGTAGAGRWLVRTVLYLAGTTVAVIAGLFNGIDQYDAKYCRLPDSCDDDDLSSLVWGVNGMLIGLGVCLVLIVVIELVLRNRRKQLRGG